MPQLTFSTHEDVSLEKKVEFDIKPVETKPEHLDNIYEVDRCVEWIRSNNFQRVCLQFPDHLLPDSSHVALKIQTVLKQTVYILGDTAYASCCIDYIAAAHVNADAIIHYGPTCFSKPTADIPCLYIYEKCMLLISELRSEVSEKLKDTVEDIFMLIDTPYIYCIENIILAFQENTNVYIHKVDHYESVPKHNIIVFVGKDQRKLTNIQLACKPIELFYFENCLLKYEVELRVLKRRNYLIEKIKDSKSIGVVIGTLGIKNYLLVIERIKKLISINGKKYYLISVGKPTVAKLANFPEFDIYVVVTCSLSEIFENRDFYKPIATPFDIEMALNSEHSKDIQFSYDYNKFLGETFDSQNLLQTVGQEVDVSLLTNKMRYVEQEEGNISNTKGSNQIAIRSDGTLALNTSYGAGYLADRTWKGLEQNLGQTEVELAQEGRSGLAQKYKNEEI